MQGTKRPFIIGFFGHMAIVSAFIILLYATTFKEAMDVLLTALAMMTIGLFMAVATINVKFQPFDFKQFFQTILWTVLNFAVILVINKYVPFSIELSIPLSERYFGVLMGVAEECFFRVWICLMIYKMMNNAWIAIGGSSLIWSVYHIYRYGGNLNVLAIIFMCGCILGASLIYSRNADSCIIAHGCVNWLAI